MNGLPLLASLGMCLSFVTATSGFGQVAEDIQIREEKMLVDGKEVTTYTPLDKDGNRLNINAGIGAMIKQEEGTGELRVMEVIEGLGAAAAGLQEGDVILKVGEYEATGKDIFHITFRLRGPEGTQVPVTIRPKGTTTPKEIVITRMEIPLGDTSGAAGEGEDEPTVPTR